MPGQIAIKKSVESEIDVYKIKSSYLLRQNRKAQKRKRQQELQKKQNTIPKQI